MPVGRSSAKTHQIGSHAEDEAWRFLRANGYALVAQNWHKSRVGELDLVVCKGDELVFVEVKKRTHDEYGDALASISLTKQQKIIKTAQYFLSEHEQYQHYYCRFDVIAFQGKANELIWIDNAFM